MARQRRCNFCDGEAVVIVSFVRDNAIKEVCYCEQHAQAYGVLDSCAYGLIDQVQVESKAVATAGRACPCCHYTAEDLFKTNLMGCGDCYAYFRDIVGSILQRLYAVPIHFGKVPSKYYRPESYLPRINLLKQQLAAAIATENFEQAARIKRKLQCVERQIKMTKKKVG